MPSQESQRTKLLQVRSVGSSYILLLSYNNLSLLKSNLQPHIWIIHDVTEILFEKCSDMRQCTFLRRGESVDV